MNSGNFDGLQTTIDKAGRIVVPKAMRDAMGLTAGGKVDLVFEDGRLTLEPSPVEAWADIAEDGFPIIRYTEDVPPLSDEIVRTTLESLREERLDHLAALESLADAGISGGSAYDGLIAMTARHHGYRLLSFDRRAERTYRAVGVGYEIVAP